MFRSIKGADGEMRQEESGAWVASMDAEEAGAVRTPKLRKTVAHQSAVLRRVYV
jgi:hypothetical protein